MNGIKVNYKLLYPAEVIEWLKSSDSSRNHISLFMHTFKECVDSGETPPQHWIEFAAELLNDAAYAAEKLDKKKRPEGIMKALRLSGRVSIETRDHYISRALFYVSKRDKVDIEVASVSLAEDLKKYGFENYSETLRNIYYKYMRQSGSEEKEDIEGMVKGALLNGNNENKAIDNFFYNVNYMASLLLSK